MTATRILVVDDNPINLKLMRFVLVEAGHDVQTARDVTRAFECIAERCPQLVLVDLYLPGVDGIEFTRRLKRDPTTRDLIVVAVTASATMGDRACALAAGCDLYVTKPIDIDALLSIVKESVNRGSLP